MNEKSFDVKRIAEGYKERPYLHKQVIALFQEEFGYKEYDNGLDVGCGAGLSTKALKMICKEVTGSDISEQMISVAQEVCDREGFTFIKSDAESTPIPEKKYDIVTAAGMVQWVNVEVFLKRMNLVMDKQGMLLIYDFGITDQMKDDDGYCDWWHDKYLKKFPKPYRNEGIWIQNDVQPYGFDMVKQVKYNLEYEFTLEAFIKFMMIQSNVNAQVDHNKIGLEEAEAWFYDSLSPIFQRNMRKLIFSGYSWYLKKSF